MKYVFCLVLVIVLPFVLIAQTPGGVSNSLIFWVKADASSNFISSAEFDTLTDQSGQGNHARIVSINKAPYNTTNKLINFNSTASFEGQTSAISYELPNLQITGEVLLNMRLPLLWLFEDLTAHQYRCHV